MFKKSKEELRRLMELRRSSASSPKPSKKEYKRIRQNTRKMIDLSKE
jgi:5-formyltetrahydrofolate cyclo-ligase